jgi:hypothetical protein
MKLKQTSPITSFIPPDLINAVLNGKQPLTEELQNLILGEPVPRWVRRDKAAHFLGVKPGTLACWASTKLVPLPFFRRGRFCWYRKEDLALALLRRYGGFSAVPEGQ